MQTCWDGSVIPATDACPADTRVTCWDGSVALSEAACPAQPTPEPTPDNSITIGSVSDVNSAVKWCNANGISTTQDNNIGVGSFVFYYNGNERKEPGETVPDRNLLRLVYNNGE